MSERCNLPGCDRPARRDGRCLRHAALGWQPEPEPAPTVEPTPASEPASPRQQRQPKRTATPRPKVERSTCAVPGCDAPMHARGYCMKHHRRLLRHGDPMVNRARVRGTCSVPGCDAPHRARGYCNKHYIRWRTYGDPLAGKQSGAQPQHAGPTPEQWEAFRAVLRRVLDRLKGDEHELVYGFPFVSDPRDFVPDPECTDWGEIQRWMQDVERAERNEPVERQGCITSADGRLHLIRSAWGLGTNFVRGQQRAA